MDNEPTQKDLNSPEFDAIWDVIKGWDIDRTGSKQRWAGATGTDVMIIIKALREKDLLKTTNQ
jgi:hypothetical protein